MINGGTVSRWACINFSRSVQESVAWGFCNELDQMCQISGMMGGRNTVLWDAISCKIPLVSDVQTIMFGADVTHPENGEDSSPSIVAVVASQDWPEVTKYAGSVCAQAHRQELMQDLYKSWHNPVRGTVSSGMIRFRNFEWRP